MGAIRAAGVDMDGLLRLLGENLYTTPAIAIRELVQNAHDSIVRRRIAEQEWTGGLIRLRPDVARRRVEVVDDGAGLTEEEIVDQLATLGAGGTRLARAEAASADADDLIGMFGIGFLSAFVVAERVVVTTTSHRDETTWRYSSKDGQRYTLEQVALRPVGTTVELHLRDSADHLADAARVRHLASRYFALLPTPVLVGDEPEPVNAASPPWTDDADDAVAPHPIQARKVRLEFAGRFEKWFSPLVTMDVEPDPGGHVQGLAWIQDGATYGSSDNRNVSLFVRGMLVDDDARDLLPRWAGFVGAVLTSRTLQPTASREDVTRNDDWQAAVRWVSDEVTRGLAAIADTQPEAWRTVVTRHNEALLGAALTDDTLFELLADDLTVPTSEGDLRVAELRRRGKRTIYVSADEGGDFQRTVLRAMHVPVATGSRYAVLPFLRRWVARRGGELAEIGTGTGDEALFGRAAVEDDVREWLTDGLAEDGEEMVPARFDPTSLPLAVVADREAEIKNRIEDDDAARRIASGALALARLRTAGISGERSAHLYVNLANPAIRRLLEERPDRNHPAVRLVRAIKHLVGGAGDLDAALGETTQAVVHLCDLSTGG